MNGDPGERRDDPVVEALRAEVAALQRELDRLVEESQQGRAAMATAVERMDGLASRVVMLTALPADVVDVRGDLNRLRHDLERRTDAVGDVGAQLTTLSARLDRLDGIEPEVGSLRDALTQAADDLRDRGEQVERTMARVAHLAAQISAVESLPGDVDALRQSLNRVQGDVEHLTGRVAFVDGLPLAVDSLRQTVAAITSELGQIGGRVQALEPVSDSVSYVRAELGRMTDDARTTNEFLDSVNTRVERLRERFEPVESLPSRVEALLGDVVRVEQEAVGRERRLAEATHEAVAEVTQRVDAMVPDVALVKPVPGQLLETKDENERLRIRLDEIDAALRAIRAAVDGRMSEAIGGHDAALTDALRRVGEMEAAVARADERLDGFQATSLELTRLRERLERLPEDVAAQQEDLVARVRRAQDTDARRVLALTDALVERIAGVEEAMALHSRRVERLQQSREATY